VRCVDLPCEHIDARALRSPSHPQTRARARAPLQGEGRECCIEYEMHNGAGWFRLAKAAILRNENSRRTTFELVLLPHPPHLPLGASAPIHRVRRCLCPSPPRLQAMARSDLIGTTEEFAKRWKEGLRFGFSMLVNDGDDAVEQVFTYPSLTQLRLARAAFTSSPRLSRTRPKRLNCMVMI